MDNLLEELNDRSRTARIRKCGVWLLLHWQAWWSRHAARKVLAAMSDEQLRDIGFKRSDVEREERHRTYGQRPW